MGKYLYLWLFFINVVTVVLVIQIARYLLSVKKLLRKIEQIDPELYKHRYAGAMSGSMGKNITVLNEIKEIEAVPEQIATGTLDEYRTVRTLLRQAKMWFLILILVALGPVVLAQF